MEESGCGHLVSTPTERWCLVSVMFVSRETLAQAIAKRDYCERAPSILHCSSGSAFLDESLRGRRSGLFEQDPVGPSPTNRDCLWRNPEILRRGGLGQT